MNPAVPIVRKAAMLAEDQHSVRLNLAGILRDHCGFERVVEVGHLDEAVRLLGEDGEIAFAIFDLGMPGLQGASNLHGVRQVYPDLVLAVLTGSERRQDILEALAAGAHGYILKSLEAAQIAEAFDALLAGTIVVPWLVADLPRSGDGGEIPLVAALSPAFGKLTPRQQDVLELIRENRTNKQIAQALGLTENTVKVHVSGLFRLLGVHNRSTAAALRLDCSERVTLQGPSHGRYALDRKPAGAVGASAGDPAPAE